MLDTSARVDDDLPVGDGEVRDLRVGTREKVAVSDRFCLMSRRTPEAMRPRAPLVRRDETEEEEEKEEEEENGLMVDEDESDVFGSLNVESVRLCLVNASESDPE